MVTELFAALGAGLSLWGSKEKRKYQDRLMNLQRNYYEEDNKDRPDMATLDNIEFELLLLSRAFSAQVGAENAKNSPK